MNIIAIAEATGSDTAPSATRVYSLGRAPLCGFEPHFKLDLGSSIRDNGELVYRPNKIGH